MQSVFKMIFKFASSIVAIALLFSTHTGTFAQAAPEKIRLPDGFKAEQVYRVPEEQGSWVNMTTDPQGRLITSDQYGKLYRVTVGQQGTQPKIETIDLEIGRAQGLLCAFKRLYVVAHSSKTQPAGLYCLRDTDKDDQYDSVELLRKFEGGGEHGPHAVVLSPDGKSLYICAGNNTKLPDLHHSLVPQLWEEDQLLERMPDAGGHNTEVMAPGGWVCRTDKDGKEFVLVSMGYRNEYDIAFDPNGELFTFDADMEWDFGLPWYRPTRVCQVIPGSEYGWRNGSGKWPSYYADSLPSIVDIGPGSPTGVTFGTNAKFPSKYQQAFFIADWSYGIIYAVHLRPSGSTYEATVENFCSAPALPVTDLVINRSDGAMYFLVGGRKSSSALYRITYQGEASTRRAQYPSLSELGKFRRKLESRLEFNYAAEPNVLVVQPDHFKDVIKALSHPDRTIRFIARSVIERSRIKYWRSLITSHNPSTALEAAMALIRVKPGDDIAVLQNDIVTALRELDWTELSAEQRLHLVRNYGLVLMRLGEASPRTLSTIKRYREHFPVSSNDPMFAELNMELAKLLVAVGDESVVEKTLQLMNSPISNEQKIHYAMVLSVAKQGWNDERRRRYFKWFLDTADVYGGNSFSGYLDKIRDRAIATLSKVEKESLAELLKQKPAPQDPYAKLKSRPLIQQWSMNEFGSLDKVDFSTRDLENGKKLFAEAQCFQCHRIRGQGGVAGPDLTPAGHRFSSHDLLEAIVDPDKAISDQYQATLFQMDDGETVSGRVVNLVGNEYLVQPDMIKPNDMVRLKASEIDEMKPSSKSAMPTGLLDHFDREEIFDLMAYLKTVAHKE